LFSILISSNSNGFNVEENIADMDVEVFMLFQVASVAMASLEDFFIATDQNGAWCKFVSRPKCWSFGILATLRTTPTLSRTITNHFHQVSGVDDGCGAKYHQPYKINQRSW
jgi:hypothetical protein